MANLVAQRHAVVDGGDGRHFVRCDFVSQANAGLRAMCRRRGGIKTQPTLYSAGVHQHLPCVREQARADGVSSPHRIPDRTAPGRLASSCSPPSSSASSSPHPCTICAPASSAKFSTTRARSASPIRAVARSCSLHARWPATRTHLASCIIWRCETFSLLHSFIKLFK